MQSYPIHGVVIGELFFIKAQLMHLARKDIEQMLVRLLIGAIYHDLARDVGALDNLGSVFRNLGLLHIRKHVHAHGNTLDKRHAFKQLRIDHGICQLGELGKFCQ